MRTTIQESTWKRQWQDSVACRMSGTQQPQSILGCSLPSVGWPGQKHVLNVPGAVVVGYKWWLWLSQVWQPAQCGYFPISRQTPGESAVALGPWQGGGVSALPWLLPRVPHSSVLSLMEACRETGAISSTPASNSLGTCSGVQVPGNRQPVCWGHRRASLAMLLCATWAQTGEEELWESQRNARKINVQSRVGALRQGWSVAQGLVRENS